MPFLLPGNFRAIQLQFIVYAAFDLVCEDYIILGYLFDKNRHCLGGSCCAVQTLSTLELSSTSAVLWQAPGYRMGINDRGRTGDI
jgi:hypothetical protein